MIKTAWHHKKVKFWVVLAWLVILSLSLSGCKGTPLAPPEELQPGTYTGVFIITASPLLEYAQKAMDDPASVPKMTGDNAEACEEFDLNDEEVRKQVTEALDKGKAALNKEVPLTIVVSKGATDQDPHTATVKVDFAKAFPDQGCEEATDEPFDLTHSPGSVSFSKEQVEEGETLKTILEGKILADGVLEGSFKMTSSNAEYFEYTKTDIMIEGTWKATRGQ